MLLRVSSILVSTLLILFGPNATEAGQSGRRAARCQRPIMCVPQCYSGMHSAPCGMNCLPSNPCKPNSVDSAANVTSEGEWRTETRPLKVIRVLPNGERVEETRQVQVRRLVPNSELLQEQRAEIETIKAQLNNAVKALDDVKASKAEVKEALDKKQDKPVSPEIKVIRVKEVGCRR
jgi:hypothetical protein